MKKVFAFAAFAFLLTSCDSSGKYKPMIDELAGKWDSATSAVTDFASQVQAAQAEMASMNNDLNVSDDTMASWDDAAKAEFSQIKSSAQTSMNNLSSINTELDGFISNWQAKGQELEAMQEGLENGKLEGDVQAKIADLTATANDAAAKLDTWKTKLAEVQAAAANAKQQLATFMQNSGMDGKS